MDLLSLCQENTQGPIPLITHYAVSDLSLHCLPMSHEKNALLIWFKKILKMCQCNFCSHSRDYTLQLFH